MNVENALEDTQASKNITQTTSLGESNLTHTSDQENRPDVVDESKQVPKAVHLSSSVEEHGTRLDFPSSYLSHLCCRDLQYLNLFFYLSDTPAEINLTLYTHLHI